MSVTPITHLGQPTSTYQLQTHHPPTSSLSPRVNAVIRLHLKMKKNMSNIPSKTTALIGQWVMQLTFIQEVAGLNPAGEQLFFLENQYILHAHFFKIQL